MQLVEGQGTRLTVGERIAMTERIRDFPPLLDEALAGLSSADLYTEWMTGEWTVAQNVHHVADVAMNSFIRMKLMLLEDQPRLKTYEQNDWAQTNEARTAPLEPSLAIIHGVHERWYRLLHDALDRDWAEVKGIHPEAGELLLDDLMRYYSGHGQLHIDQIGKTLAARNA